MSRVGRQPIPVPETVQVAVDGPRLRIRGQMGELEHEVPADLEVEYADDRRTLALKVKSDSRRARSLHGLHRTLIANKVKGVAEGFAKRLEIHGMGYTVNLKGRQLVLQVGFCHEVTFDLPDGVSAEIEQNSAQVDRPARFVLKGRDKELVGQLAATIRAVRRPEPYKGKGIRYEGEYVRHKESKAFTGLEK